MNNEISSSVIALDCTVGVSIVDTVEYRVQKYRKISFLADMWRGEASLGDVRGGILNGVSDFRESKDKVFVVGLVNELTYEAVGYAIKWGAWLIAGRFNANTGVLKQLDVGYAQSPRPTARLLANNPERSFFMSPP